MNEFSETQTIVVPRRVVPEMIAAEAKEQQLPALWKQTMVVLLVLFPIVMFEFKYLTPLLKDLDISLSTFIGNMISVSLISFPGMQVVFYFLGWWLTPKPGTGKIVITAGTFLVVALYVLEVWFFWGFI